MEIIKFNCRNQRLSRINSGIVASNSYGYLKIQVNFLTNDWSKVHTRFANFSYCGRNYPRLLDEDGMCFVPEEVLKIVPRCPFKFKVSVYGGGITSNTVTIEFEDSGLTPYEDDSTNTKYLNEIINQLTAELDDLHETKADNITYNEEDNTIQLTANGQLIGDSIQAHLCSCGIQKITVDENNNVIITMEDGSVINIGQSGGTSTGVSVSKFEIDENGDLLAVYSDGTIANIGHVVGSDGKSYIYVPEVTEDGMLIFTLKDNAEEEKLEFDINKNNDWSPIGGNEDSDYIWEPM